jgi:hypothetical protein
MALTTVFASCVAPAWSGWIQVSRLKIHDPSVLSG